METTTVEGFYRGSIGAMETTVETFSIGVILVLYWDNGKFKSKLL